MSYLKINEYHVVLYLIVLFIPSSVLAQPLLNGVQNAVLGHASAAMPNIEWPESNPASLTGIEKASITFYSSEGYGMRALRTQAINAVFPLNSGPRIGIVMHTFGYSAYRESTLTSTLSQRLYPGSSRSIRVGISGIVKHTIIRSVGRSTHLALSTGLILDIWPDLYFGVSYSHWIQSRQSELLEEILSVGLAYHLSASTSLMCAVKKAINYPSSLSMGIEHKIQDYVILRTGIHTSPYRLALGLEYKSNKVKAGLSAEKHILLNWTPALSIGLYV